MNISTNYNFYKYNTCSAPERQSFGSAADISLKYILKNHYNLIPDRMKKEAAELVKKGVNDVSLRDLHLQIYKGLLDCKTLDEARNIYPEFLEVLPYKSAMQKNSVNTRKIGEKISLDDLPLYLLKERWGKLTNVEDITKQFGLKSRGSITWIMDKLKIPEFGKNYQTILNASDETRNNIIAQKTKLFNAAHSDWVRERNATLARDPKSRKLNKELSDEVWARTEEIRIAMSNFYAEHPDYSLAEFDRHFWDSHPEFKKLISKVKSELGAERRAMRKAEKTRKKL